MSDVILYTTDDGETKIDLRLQNGTAWLTQVQVAELFQATKQNISLHLKNIFENGEITQEATVKESLTVQTEGKRKVQRTLTELNAIEEREMRMGDHVGELDTILNSAGRKLLDNAGTISNAEAKEKAKRELQKYKAKTLGDVEKD